MSVGGKGDVGNTICTNLNHKEDLKKEGQPCPREARGREGDAGSAPHEALGRPGLFLSSLPPARAGAQERPDPARARGEAPNLPASPLSGQRGQRFLLPRTGRNGLLLATAAVHPSLPAPSPSGCQEAPRLEPLTLTDLGDGRTSRRRKRGWPGLPALKSCRAWATALSREPPGGRCWATQTMAARLSARPTANISAFPAPAMVLSRTRGHALPLLGAPRGGLAQELLVTEGPSPFLGQTRRVGQCSETPPLAKKQAGLGNGSGASEWQGVGGLGGEP